MTDLSRRGLLGGAALGLAATALGACATRPEAAPAAARSLGMAAPVPPNPALRPDLEVRTIGCGSCFNQGRTGETLEAAIRARPDLFLFMGDNVYGDVTSPEMNELLSAYAGALARPDYRRFREAMPHLAVWDDHDYGDNDAGATFAYRQATRPLFLDFWDVPADSPRRTRDGVWDAVTVGPQGRRTQFILLDTRTWRDDWTPTDERDAPGKERYVPNPDPAKTILGPAQWAWLGETLLEPADLRVLVTSYQLVADGHGWERWGLFPAERARLYDLLRRTEARNLFVLSGDRHLSAVYREDRALPWPLHELTASSMNMASSSWRERAEEAGPNRLTPTFRDNNFGLVRIDWEARRIGFEIKDKSDATVLSHAFDLPASGA